MQYVTLRFNKIFTKSRFSRTRQWAKTIVYFGLWFNLGSVIYLYFYCYQFTLGIIFVNYWVVVLSAIYMLVFFTALQPIYLSNWFVMLLGYTQTYNKYF